MAEEMSLDKVLADIRKEFGKPAFRRADKDAPEPPPIPDPAVVAASYKLASEPAEGPDHGGPLT